jgi:uncharacterized membrane protein
MPATAIRLSQDTIDILKNFATINNSLKFKAGSELRTINNTGSVAASAQIQEVIPQDFAIYELPKFLSVLNLPNMKDAELVFEDDKKVQIRSEKSVINYFFTEQTFVTHPDKVLNLPSVELNVELSDSVLDSFRRAASALGHTLMTLRVVDNNAFIIATTPNNDTSNDYSDDLGTVQADNAEYNLKVQNVNLIPGDYQLEISAAGVTKFQHKTRDIVYFIGLEKQ